MGTVKKNHRYIEWLSAEELHDATTHWMSELKFVRDEQLFLNDLIKSYTLQLIEPDVFDEIKGVIDTLSNCEKEVVILMKKVQAHENLLEIMINEVDELPMEKAYVQMHMELASLMDGYLSDYKKVKTRLFKVATKVLKKKKQKKLLN